LVLPWVRLTSRYTTKLADGGRPREDVDDLLVDVAYLVCNGVAVIRWLRFVEICGLFCSVVGLSVPFVSAVIQLVKVVQMVLCGPHFEDVEEKDPEDAQDVVKLWVTGG